MCSTRQWRILFENMQRRNDEIQKVPALLDEVHWLIENKKLNFILCG